MSPARIDPIALEVLRTRLVAIAEEGATTVERTACSPVIAESRDNGCAVLDAKGGLIVGGGAVAHNFGACIHAVRNVLAIHGHDLRPGDMFFSNDPHNGGGLHPQDVIVQLPVFAEDRLVAWIANAGHMMDMGGMAFGSWAPAATECYQEALRLPPVRLFREGREQTDVWAIIRNNVRVSAMVEMDLRSLVAGCHAAHDKLSAIVRQMAADRFVEAIAVLEEVTGREFRRRIGRLADGTYTVRSWTEWDDELYPVPCTLVISGDQLTFDFAGAAAQTNRFFNSKAHIIRAILVSDVSDVLAHDIPLNQGMFDAIDVLCPPGSVVDSTPPSPVASAHFDVALNASMAAQQCVMMAIAASGEDAPGRHLQSGPLSPSCMGLHTWSFTTEYGTPDGWLMLDGSLSGGSAGFDRDGYDLFSFMVAKQPVIEAIDIELLEQRFPVMVESKRPRAGSFGAGKFRSGAGCEMRYRPYGTNALTGVMLGMRERVPLAGLAGGRPGSNTTFWIEHGGRRRTVSGHSNGLPVAADEIFGFALGSGGGYGDPVDRDPARVAHDVMENRITAEEAREVYGVVLGEHLEPDAAETVACRKALLAARLDRASPPARPVGQVEVPAMPVLPLYAGVEQRGDLAIATESGAILARAPDFWTNGCAVLTETISESAEIHSYLDPLTGKYLLVDVVPTGKQWAIRSLPKSWTDAAVAA